MNIHILTDRYHKYGTYCHSAARRSCYRPTYPYISLHVAGAPEKKVSEPPPAYQLFQQLAAYREEGLGSGKFGPPFSKILDPRLVWTLNLVSHLGEFSCLGEILLS